MTSPVSSTSGTSSTAQPPASSPPATPQSLLAAAQKAAQTAAQSIISGSGIGSSLNLPGLLASLMTVQSVPLLALQAQAAGVQTQISAFGTLSSAFSSFETTVSALTLSSTFQTLQAATSDQNVASASVSPSATSGSFDVNVSTLATSTTLATQGQQSTSAAIGTGAPTAVTITLGTLSSSTPPTFIPNGGQSNNTITIDSSNDSLQGIAQAIKADPSLGVTAKVINNGSGSPFQLEITSNQTGANQVIQITTAGAGGGAGDPTISNLLNFDPTTFNPSSPSTTGMTADSLGSNAFFTINGSNFQSASNTVDSSFPGLALTLFGKGETTITVGQATAGLQQQILGFVQAYNALQSAIAPLNTFNASNPQADGPLIGNSTLSLLTNQLQSIVSSSVPGLSDIRQLADIGITLDPSTGDLALNSSTLSSALASNPTSLQGLFDSQFTASDPNALALGPANGTSPQSGTFPVTVTHAATQGSVTSSVTAATVPTTATSLQVKLDGADSQQINIGAGPFATMADYAAALQSAINSNSTFQANGESVAVSVNASNQLVVTSATFGHTSSVEISGADATTLFGSSDNVGQFGTDIQGTIGGVTATGSGQILTASSGTAAQGLQVQLAGSQTGSRGTISFSLGIVTQMLTTMENATDVQGQNGATSNGAITNAVNTLNQQITSIDQQETATQAFINSVAAINQAEFTQLQTTLAKMATTQSFLQQTFNPTSSNN
ncbi:MAG: flagellar filament capping protein FliD [Pararobbsia sp.]